MEPEVEKMPSGDLPRIPLDPEQRRALRRLDGHIEISERSGQAVADRLKIGFLPGPAAKKGLDPFGAVQAPQAFGFEPRIEPFGDLHCFDGRINFFDVDTDFAFRADCDGNYFPRMGYAECKRTIDSRLAVRPVPEADVAGPNAETGAEQAPQNTAGKNELATITFEIEPSSARRLVWIKNLRQR
jgi:hypothetical protein